MNLLECADGSTNTKSKTNKKMRNTLLTKDQPQSGTPYLLWTCLTAEHHTHHGPASLWTFLTAEDPTHLGHAPPQNTLFTLDLPHRGTTEGSTHYGPTPPRNILLTMDMPNLGTPYSTWTCLFGKNPAYMGGTESLNMSEK